MPVTAWIMIGTSAVGIVFTVWWFFRRRQMLRLEALEAAVFGESGVRHKYVTRPEFEKSISDLATRMAGISDEGQAREVRILEAINTQALTVGSAVHELKNDVGDRITELKTDIRSQGARVDTLILMSGSNSR